MEKKDMNVSTATTPGQKIYTPQYLAKCFDQSILRPDNSSSDLIKRSAEDAKKFGFRALVVHPCKVPLTKSLLTGTNTLTASVSDFPHGRGLTASRVEDVKELLKTGADEIDIVSRYERLLEGDFEGFEKDLRAIVKAVNGKVLKIILEVDLLSLDLIKAATEIIGKFAHEDSKAKLIVKTKTGFAEFKIPNLEAVRIIKAKLEETGQYAKNLNELGNGMVGIKASGGVKTKEDAIQLLEAGAHILGTSSGEKMAQ